MVSKSRTVAGEPLDFSLSMMMWLRELSNEVTFLGEQCVCKIFYFGASVALGGGTGKVAAL